MAAKTNPRTTAEALQDDELLAMARVLDALKDLAPDVQQNVIDWAVRRFKLTAPSERRDSQRLPGADVDNNAGVDVVDALGAAADGQDSKMNSSTRRQNEEIEGVNARAQNWIKRAGLSEGQLSKLFTLGVENIDLVAKKVPGSSKAQRLKSVLLLQGVAAYLGSGVARVDWKKLKEAAGHYNADVGGNFPTYMKNLAPQATGSVATGYTLTSRGLNEAKELIEEITSLPTKA